MMKLYDIVFSPTGGSQKVAAALTDALEREATRVDLTDSKQNFRAIQLTQDDVRSFPCRPTAGVFLRSLYNGWLC